MTENMKEQLEQSVGDTFFEWLNIQRRTNYCFSRRAGEAPDLVYADGDKELFVEVTTAYAHKDHAEFLWKNASGARNAPEVWDGIEPDRSLAQEVVNLIANKSKKRYGNNCILLVNIPPGVTPEGELLVLLTGAPLPAPVDLPFVGVYVVGRFPVRDPFYTGGYGVIPIKELQ